MAKYILKLETNGMDWHDTYQTTEFLQEDGKYEIQDVIKTIAVNVHKLLTEMISEGGRPVTRIKLSNIPSVSQITDCIQNKKRFSCSSKDEYELEASWDPHMMTLRQYYFGGQVYSDVEYHVSEIAPENLVYIPVETFLCPMKGCPSAERFYKAPFTDLAEANAELDRIKERIRKNGYKKTAVPQLLIKDRNELKKNYWFELNTKVNAILDAHPELDTAEHFRMLVRSHLDHLKEITAA